MATLDSRQQHYQEGPIINSESVIAFFSQHLTTATYFKQAFSTEMVENDYFAVDRATSRMIIKAPAWMELLKELKYVVEI